MARILETRLVPIDSVKPFPGNPKKGDVGVIRESIRTNGFYRSIVVWEAKGWILAGNHTWMACKEEGHTQISAEFIEVKDLDEAKKINLVDNRAPEHGTYDEEALVAMLGSIPDLAGTGWTQSDYERMVNELGESPDYSSDGDGEDDVPDDSYEAQLGVIVTVKDQEQQQNVYEALQALTLSDKTFEGAELKIVAV